MTGPEVEQFVVGFVVAFFVVLVLGALVLGATR